MTNFVQFPGLGLEFQVSRVAFTIGSMNVYWYGIILATGLLLGAMFAFHYAADFGIDADRFIDVLLIGTVCAVICARAFYVAFAPFKYESFWDMINIRDGGIAIYGAVIGAFVFGGLACKWRRQPVLPTYDIVAMGFLIGQGVGRWGNFVNQEAFGCNTTLPWGMISENTQRYLAGWQSTLAQQGVTVDPALPVHPTFLYESLWCFAGFLALWAYMKHRRFNGELTLLYVIWYGLGRFWIEGLRTDSLMTPFMNLRVSQLIALVSVLTALVLEIVLRRKYRGKPLLVTLAVDKGREKLFAASEKAAGRELPQRELPTLAASASHKQFAQATKEMNDAWFGTAQSGDEAQEQPQTEQEPPEQQPIQEQEEPHGSAEDRG